VKEIYKVTPVRVNIVNLPAKIVFARGKTGRKSAIKKAIVTLKKGDKIEFV
jgi:ribosomal protein L23